MPITTTTCKQASKQASKCGFTPERLLWVSADVLEALQEAPQFEFSKIERCNATLYFWGLGYTNGSTPNERASLRAVSRQAACICYASYA
jgi:hypothetical protein